MISLFLTFLAKSFWEHPQHIAKKGMFFMQPIKNVNSLFKFLLKTVNIDMSQELRLHHASVTEKGFNLSIELIIHSVAVFTTYINKSLIIRQKTFKKNKA
jgi:hypothetical protein